MKQIKVKTNIKAGLVVNSALWYGALKRKKADKLTKIEATKGQFC